MDSKVLFLFALAEDFFEETVDKNSNKFVLAVSVYKQNDWLIMCSKVCAEVGEIIIFSTIELLEIDKKITKKQKIAKYDSSWNGVREFFKDKISQLKEARNNAVVNCERGKLFAAIFTEILETLIRQLGEMEFFFSHY